MEIDFSLREALLPYIMTLACLIKKHAKNLVR